MPCSLQCRGLGTCLDISHHKGTGGRASIAVIFQGGSKFCNNHKKQEEKQGALKRRQGGYRGAGVKAKQKGKIGKEAWIVSGASRERSGKQEEGPGPCTQQCPILAVP